jgi:hypothetical protein
VGRIAWTGGHSSSCLSPFLSQVMHHAAPLARINGQSLFVFMRFHALKLHFEFILAAEDVIPKPELKSLNSCTHHDLYFQGPNYCLREGTLTRIEPRRRPQSLSALDADFPSRSSTMPLPKECEYVVLGLGGSGIASVRRAAGMYRVKTIAVEGRLLAGTSFNVGQMRGSSMVVHRPIPDQRYFRAEEGYLERCICYRYLEEGKGV